MKDYAVSTVKKNVNIKKCSKVVLDKKLLASGNMLRLNKKIIRLLGILRDYRVCHIELDWLCPIKNSFLIR